MRPLFLLPGRIGSASTTSESDIRSVHQVWMGKRPLKSFVGEVSPFFCCTRGIVPAGSKPVQRTEVPHLPSQSEAARAP